MKSAPRSEFWKQLQELSQPPGSQTWYVGPGSDPSYTGINAMALLLLSKQPDSGSCSKYPRNLRCSLQTAAAFVPQRFCGGRNFFFLDSNTKQSKHLSFQKAWKNSSPRVGMPGPWRLYPPSRSERDEPNNWGNVLSRV